MWGIRTPASLVESRGDLPIVEHAALLYESGILIFSALPLNSTNGDPSGIRTRDLYRDRVAC